MAQATAEGYAGIGIVRISGPSSLNIAKQMLSSLPTHKQAEYCAFKDNQGDVIDKGIALFFKKPHSLTGEDILELQAHGGPIVMERLIHTALEYGARRARPGEFLERAFLNNKIDLIQAEATHDLIHATSLSAARSAMRSMQGCFSEVILEFSDALINLRMYIEASIDFPEEELDLLKEGEVYQSLLRLIEKVKKIKQEAIEGARLSKGVKCVIVGKPNAGKSSLLNALSGVESAIVTDIAGTTRDVLREEISLDGMLFELVDTAGIHNTVDTIERIGILRAEREIELADHVILVLDSTELNNKNPSEFLKEWPQLSNVHQKGIKVTLLCNKIDKLNCSAKIVEEENYSIVYASAKTKEGLSLLRTHLKKSFARNTNENVFSARGRHIDAISKALQHLITAEQHLRMGIGIELLAEELKSAQINLDEILGRFSNDDLLGKIFSEFCIGK